MADHNSTESKPELLPPAYFFLCLVVGIGLHSVLPIVQLIPWAYRSRMSAWCGNCHAGSHNTSYPSNLRHPSGATLGAPMAAAYGTYNG